MKTTLLVSMVVCLIAVAGPAVAGPMDDARFALHVKPHFDPSAPVPTLCPNDDPARGSYDPNYDGIPCSQYVVTASTNEAPGPHVFLVVGQGDPVGINGVACGIYYTPGGGPGNGIDEEYITWTVCADGLEFPSDFGHGPWPAPMGGNRITWATCQTQEIGADGVHAVVGVFYVYAYSEDVLQVTPRGRLPAGFRGQTASTPLHPYDELAVSDCAGGNINLLDLTDPSLVRYLVGSVHFGGDGSQGYTPCGVTPARPTTWGRIKSSYE